MAARSNSTVESDLAATDPLTLLSVLQAESQPESCIPLEMSPSAICSQVQDQGLIMPTALDLKSCIFLANPYVGLLVC